MNAVTENKKNFSNFTEKHEVISGFQKSIAKLKNNLNNTIMAFSEALSPLEKESYHFVSRLLVPETKWDKLLYSHIFKIALQSEKVSAGSSYISVLAAISFIDELLKHESFLHKNENEINEKWNEKFNELKISIEKYGKIVNKKMINSFVETLAKDENLKTALINAIELSGMEGNISVENSRAENYTIELRYGYHFPVKIFKPFLPSFGFWLQNNCKILLVDGVVEKVSEIDKILRKSYESKIPLLFVAQGFSEEVLATLKTNNDKKNFNVLPVLIETGLESLNLLSDIATVCGAKTISILTGDLLIYTNYEELPIIDFVKCNENGLLIQHGKNVEAVALQIKNLLIKRKYNNNSNVFDVANLFDKRISNLLAHSVIINLPDVSEIEGEYLRSKIDVILRTTKTLIQHGYIELKDVKRIKFNKNQQHDPIVLAFNSIIDNIHKNYTSHNKIPILSIVLGIYLTSRAMLQLLCSSGAVIIEEN
jgi:hypothetical protein